MTLMWATLTHRQHRTMKNDMENQGELHAEDSVCSAADLSLCGRGGTRCSTHHGQGSSLEGHGEAKGGNNLAPHPCLTQMNLRGARDPRVSQEQTRVTAPPHSGHAGGAHGGPGEPHLREWGFHQRLGVPQSLGCPHLEAPLEEETIKQGSQTPSFGNTRVCQGQQQGSCSDSAVGGCPGVKTPTNEDSRGVVDRVPTGCVVGLDTCDSTGFVGAPHVHLLTSCSLQICCVAVGLRMN